MKPLIGISSCLLGNKVRYDGAHKKHDWLIRNLNPLVEWYVTCPEMVMGLGAPREPMRLKKQTQNGKIHLITVKSQVNLTLAAESTACGLALSLPANINGYILKSKSPSCGLEKVKVYGPNNVPKKEGVGFFTKVLKTHYPLLPLIEESQLSNPNLMKHFMTRVYGHFHIQQLRPKVSDLQKFHHSYKYILLAHHESSVRKLERIADNSNGKNPSDILQEYKDLFLKTLAKPL